MTTIHVVYCRNCRHFIDNSFKDRDKIGVCNYPLNRGNWLSPDGFR